MLEEVKFTIIYVIFEYKNLLLVKGGSEQLQKLTFIWGSFNYGIIGRIGIPNHLAFFEEMNTVQLLL